MLGAYLYDLATDKKKGFVHVPLKAFLFVCSLLYGGLIRLLRFWQGFRQNAIGCRVVSIGNPTLGGTGKTPLTMLVAGFFSSRQEKTVILTRGYRAGSTSGDEPALMSSRLPEVRVFVDSDRLRSGRRAVKEYGATVAVLDDGFQQWRLRKDLEIVTVDAQEGFGNLRMIPAGIMREPLDGLSRADICVITNTHLQPDTERIRRLINRYNPRALVVESRLEPLFLSRPALAGTTCPLETLKGIKLGVFCGIAKPGAFLSLSRQLGYTPVFTRFFPDHHAFSRADLVCLCADSRGAQATALLTTEKDAARFTPDLLASCSLDLYTLVVQLRISTNEQVFYERLSGLLSA